VIEVQDVSAAGASGLDRFDAYASGKVCGRIDTPEVRVLGNDEFGASSVNQSAG
jgi:hypothetical protein